MPINRIMNHTTILCQSKRLMTKLKRKLAITVAVEMRPHHRCQNYSIDKSVVMSAVMLASEYRTILTSITFYRKCFGASDQFRTNLSRSISFSSMFRQNRKLRDSSNESDEELEPPASPPPRSTIDGSKNVLPSKIKAAVSNVIQFEGQNQKNFFDFFFRMSYFELGT